MTSTVNTIPVLYDIQSDDPQRDWRGYPLQGNLKYVLVDHDKGTYAVYINELWDFYDAVGAQVDEDEDGAIFNLNGQRVHESDLFEYITTHWCDPF